MNIPENKFAMVEGFTFNKNSVRPLWKQLHEHICQLYANGGLSAGVQLPSERDLSEQLQVSRATVRRCYEELRESNLLAGKGRIGSLLQTPQRVQPTMGFKSFTEEMREMGLSVHTRIDSDIVGADRNMASIFGKPSNTKFLHLIRVRYADNQPMTREVAWYDLDLAPALLEWDRQGSIYAYLQEKCGLVLNHAEQTLEAVLSSPDETKEFQFKLPSPCLLFKRKSYTQQGTLIEYVEGTFRGDAYVYRMDLNKPTAKSALKPA